MRIPLIMSADAYTISSNSFVSDEANELSIYNYTNRYSPQSVEDWEGVAQDSRMVLWGLSYFIEKYLTTPITATDVLEANDFMRSAHSFGGPMSFNVDLWMDVVKQYGGYLPINITALPEGSTFFPNEPVIQVTSKPGFGEIAAHVEARLLGMVSIGSACATLNRHWKKYLERKGCPKEALDFYIHNFGARACSTEDEDVLTGMAHLLSFNGTDNFAAAYYGWSKGLQRPIGTSIHALAHRIVQGHDKEVDAFNSIMDASKQNPIASLVADCYNYENAVDTITNMGSHFKDFTFVIRPDSGNHIQVISSIIEACKTKGLCTTNEKGILPKNVRFIYGDSVTPKKLDECLMVIEKLTGNPFGWGIFGVGGFLRNTCTRDTLSSAYKLAAVGKDRKPVVKLSETTGKLSVPGPSYIYDTKCRCEPRVSMSCNNREINTLMKCYFNASNITQVHIESLRSVHKRANEDFDNWDKPCLENPKFGLNRTSLTKEVLQIQDEYYAKYQ